MTSKIIGHASSICLLSVVAVIHTASSLSCYKCLSINGSDPSCDDLFQGDIAGKPSLLHTPCSTHLRGRNGLFPATHCIKLVAYSKGPSPVRYTYRTCGREEFDDNAINRASHCGYVKLNWLDTQRRFRGCLQICDKDACNRAALSNAPSWKTVCLLTSMFWMRSWENLIFLPALLRM